MKFIKKILFAIGFFFFGFNSQAESSENAKDSVKVGVFITSLYDINYIQQSFNVDFWIWFNWNNDSLFPMKTAMISNAKSSTRNFEEAQRISHVNTSNEFCQATIKENWNLKNFPFDNQVLKIIIEENDSDSDALRFIADKANTKFDESIVLTDWKIKNINIESGTKAYKTNFGFADSKSDTSIFSTVEVKMDLHRTGTWGLFAKLVTGVYVAFFVSMLVFWIDPVEVDPRFGLSVGSLFAAVANKYVIDSIIPETAAFTLVDKIHVTCFVGILFTMILSVLSLAMYKKNKELKSKKLDKISFYVLLVSFVLVNVFLVAKAIN